MPYRPILIAAVQAAGLTIAGFLIPFLGQIVVLFAPVPLVTVAVREGRKAGILATGAAGAVVAVVVGGQAVFVLFFISLGLMALGLSEGLLRRFKPEQAILAGGLLPLAALIVLLAPILIKAGKNPITLAEQYLRTSITDAQHLYTQLGLTDVAQMLESISDKMLYYLVRLSPGIILTTTLFQAACCYGMARSFLLRKAPALAIDDKVSLAMWHAPDNWVWGLIAALGMIASGIIGKADSTAFLVGLNLALLYLLVYASQGMSLVEFWLRKAKLSVLWRSFAHTIILTLPPLIAVVVSLGVVDIWADFRKVRGPQIQTP
jgi:uncharacterized protein YybS (DUF2232 family)